MQEVTTTSIDVCILLHTKGMGSPELEAWKCMPYPDNNLFKQREKRSSEEIFSFFCFCIAIYLAK